MYFIALVIGVVFGSFNGMIVFRIVNKIPLLNPIFSTCINCKTKIYFFDNIPLISYILLKGRCRKCKIKISPSYFFIELISVIVTFLTFLVFDLTIDFIIFSILSYILIILSFIDLYKNEVPYILLILGVAFSFFYYDFKVYDFLFMVGFGYILNFFISFYIQEIKYRIKKDINLKTQEALGDGDIPIFGIIGGVLGIKLGFIVLFVSAIIAIMPSIYLNTKNKIELPFIPFLTLGFFGIFFWSKLWF